jgi:hypothetical protein
LEDIMDLPSKRGAASSWFERLFGKKLPEPEPEPETHPKPQAGRFPTTFDRNNKTMLKQLKEVKKYKHIIEDASRRYDILPSVLCGIGSRESQWGLGLKPSGPGGRGDFARRRPRGQRHSPEPPDGPGYGRGLLQIDYDWHEMARTGKWYVPRENVMYGCTVLNNARKFFKRQPFHLNEDNMLRAIIAAYNGGATATANAIKAGQDIDANTTGKDYSRDVLNRSGWFQLHGWR